jgi:hypothetical protein
MDQKLTRQLADKIVDKDYKNSKNKNPFTQAAENARDLLSYKLYDGHLENQDGQRIDTFKEAIAHNEVLDKNLQDQKKDDYLKRLKPKLANMPIINRNINNSKNKAAKVNPTIERYKNFKEEKKFNEEFEREYSDKAIEKYVRSKVHKNRQLGKADYEDLPTSYLIVGEAAKDKAKKKLEEIRASEKLELKPDYLLQKEIIINNNPQPSMPSLDEWMRVKAPIEKDPPGITGLNKVKRFKRSADLTDQKFPKKAHGIGPFLSGEND